MSHSLLIGSIDEISEQAQKIVDTIAHDIWCQAQEWDDRIDCMTKLPDGSVIGEMIALTKATEMRFKEAAERLLMRRQGLDIQLENELRPPIHLTPANAAEILDKILYGDEE